MVDEMPLGLGAGALALILVIALLWLITAIVIDYDKRKHPKTWDGSWEKWWDDEPQD